jgi:hypothetical protein
MTRFDQKNHWLIERAPANLRSESPAVHYRSCRIEGVAGPVLTRWFAVSKLR